MPRRARVFISLALTLLLIYLFLRGIDPRDAWRETRQARSGWLIVCVVGSYLHLLLRAARWRVQLAPTGVHVPYRLALSCTALGYFLSALLPGRPGELVRPILLGARSGVSRSFALATIVVERVVLDPLTLLALLAVALLASKPALQESAESRQFLRAVWSSSGLLAAVLVLGLGAGAWALTYRQRLLGWLRRRRRQGTRRSGLWDALERFGDGLASLSSRQVWPRVVAGSVLVWAAVAAAMWGGVQAFGGEVGYSGAVVLTALAAVGVALPTPGGVGGFHLAVQFGLVTLYGVPMERSVPAAVVTHVLMLLPAFTIGAWVAWKEGANLPSLWRGPGARRPER
ncbi:MAG: lysylphosphatidylglycerol synthase transmembrane domain-containing protein [Acidobacteriota bacterium]